jgi:hypothetical protein
VHQQTPVCPGHSEDRGRTAKHIFWEMTDLPADFYPEIDALAAKISEFPGLQTFLSSDDNSSRSFSTISLLENKWTATEYKSARTIMLFLLVDKISKAKLRCWVLHLQYDYLVSD